MYSLEGKVALVTGAAGKNGIGRAIAVRLAEEGADIVVNDLIERPVGAGTWGGLPAVVEEIEAEGRRAIALQADISDSTQVQSMVDQALQVFGGIDILINNAGAPAGRDRRLVVEVEEEAWDLVQSVNVKGTFLCSQVVARTMIKRDLGGRIINLSSVAGKRGIARYAAYCTSKFAVRGFTQALALELAPHAITVNAICPVLVDTERVDDMAAALKPEGTATTAYREELVSRTAKGVPLGRIAQPDDIARSAAFLASAEADYLTGLSLTVSGGMVMD
jgi:NAD(P)-dependent dehydrogenase (short-subunit alcohol dehydrogenase family)